MWDTSLWRVEHSRCNQPPAPATATLHNADPTRHQPRLSILLPKRYFSRADAVSASFPYLWPTVIEFRRWLLAGAIW